MPSSTSEVPPSRGRDRIIVRVGRGGVGLWDPASPTSYPASPIPLKILLCLFLYVLIVLFVVVVVVVVVVVGDAH